MPRTIPPVPQARTARTQVRAANFQATAAPRTNAARPAATSFSGTNASGSTSSSSQSGCCCSSCAGLECLDRTRFFSGQLLTDADLNNEQSYWLAKSRLHNSYLIGTGIVCGLQVTCSDCDGWVTIHPGYAIDPCGNDIIVCAGQSFNVLQAINACCQPKVASDCSPLRYRPLANCQDAIQTWCITIEYKEQPSRMVTPLQQSTSQSSSCGCGCGSSAGGGCGCGSKAQSSTSCSCATAAASTSTSASCEATRIVEGFQLGVCQTTMDAANKVGTSGYSTGNLNSSKTSTTNSPLEQCINTYKSLMLQKPTLVAADGTYLPSQQAYQAACQYLASIKAALASATTDCQSLIALYGITIAAPDPQQNPEGYDGPLQEQIDNIAKYALAALLDCFCYALLPTCPPAACDNRLTLACVTLQNGKIIDICHFGGGRKQLVTFRSLGYWGALFGLDQLFATLGDGLEKLCCGDVETLGRLIASSGSQGEVLTSSLGTPASFNKAMYSMLAEKLGAAAVNTASPRVNAIDLRPLVGLDTDSAEAGLLSYGIPVDTLIPVDVSADATWTDAAVAAAATYTPAAYRVSDGTTASDPLTMYTKGKAVVGFAVASPFDVLSKQVGDLQATVVALQAQLNGPQSTTVEASTPTEAAQRKTKPKPAQEQA